MARPRRIQSREDRQAATEYERNVLSQLRRIEERREAERRYEVKHQPIFELPPLDWTLKDVLAQPRDRQLPSTVAELHYTGNNTLLVAAYKAGKTTLAVNLMQSLADGEPFLGRFDVAELEGRVAYSNYELGFDQFLNWVDDIGIENPDRVAPPLQLRGRSLPFWHPEIRKRLVEWLAANEVAFWILDPYSRASRGLVESEADNVQADEFLSLLDEIKREAEVPDLLLCTHMGRALFEEDAERSRGPTRLEDWMDHGWYLTKDGSRRSLRAMGRDVELEAIDLDYDYATRRLTATGLTRKERRDQEQIGDALAALMQIGEGASSTAWKEAIPGAAKDKQPKIAAAIRAGLIERRLKDGSVFDETQDSGNRGLYCHLTSLGKEAISGKVEREGNDGP